MIYTVINSKTNESESFKNPNWALSKYESDNWDEIYTQKNQNSKMILIVKRNPELQKKIIK